MQLVLINNRIVAHGEDFFAMGGVVINTETGKKYEHATIAECSGCPSDIDTVGYEYHAGTFIPCAPYGRGKGNVAVLCDKDCKSIKDSGVSIGLVCAMSSYMAFVGNVNANMVAAAFGKGNEDEMLGIGKALKMYANFKGNTGNVDFLDGYDKYTDLVADHKQKLIANTTLYTLIKSSPYANDILLNTNVGLPDIVLYDKGSTEYFDIENATVYDWKDNPNYGTYAWANCDSSLNTDGNISISKNAATNSESCVTYKYTIPIMKDLPKLSGYRYLRVKLSDTEVSSNSDCFNSGNSVSFAFATATSKVDMPNSKGGNEYMTGAEYSFDLFSTYAGNPAASNFVISITQRSYSNDTGSSSQTTAGSRFTNTTIHIDKIWLSET